jgi:AcrR family transcriptional regulator
MDKDGRRRIEAAALGLFARNGIEAASTREIAKAAGMAEGTLYRHFRTKEELALTIFLQFAAKLVTCLEEAVAREAAGAPQVEALVRAFYDFARDESDAWEYIMQRHPRIAGVPAGTRLPKDVVIETIVRGAASGAFTPIDPILGASLVIGMVVRSLFFLRQGVLKDPESIVQTQVSKAAVRVLKETP